MLFILLGRQGTTMRYHQNNAISAWGSSNTSINSPNIDKSPQIVTKYDFILIRLFIVVYMSFWRGYLLGSKAVICFEWLNCGEMTLLIQMGNQWSEIFS